MGLFDGRIDPSTPSARRRGRPRTSPACSARRSCSSSTPAGQSHSVAALLHGFATFDHSVRIAGVILNRVGHAAARAGAAAGLRAGRRAGARRDPAGRRIVRSVKASRPGHRGRARQARAARPSTAMTELVARHVDLAAVAAAAGSRVDDAAVGSRRRRSPSADGVVVALAAGKAFSFGYPEHAELLRAAGADVVEFDPLTEPLPAAHRGAGAARRVPRAVHRRAVRQRRCAPADRRARRVAVRRSTPSARA